MTKIIVWVDYYVDDTFGLLAVCDTKADAIRYLRGYLEQVAVPGSYDFTDLVAGTTSRINADLGDRCADYCLDPIDYVTFPTD